MALTELQLPTKVQFYAELQESATQMNRLMNGWKDLAEFLENMGTADMDTLVLDTGQVRTDLIDYRVAINEFLAFFNGTGSTQTVVPAEIVDKIRRMR